MGYSLSPLLIRKLPGCKSAGRVQSVVLRLIAEREKEILNFNPVSSYKTTAEFINSNNVKFKAKYSINTNDDDNFNSFVDGFKNAEFIVSSIKKSPLLKKPAPPFTTSTINFLFFF